MEKTRPQTRGALKARLGNGPQKEATLPWEKAQNSPARKKKKGPLWEKYTPLPGENCVGLPSSRGGKKTGGKKGSHRLPKNKGANAAQFYFPEKGGNTFRGNS